MNKNDKLLQEWQERLGLQNWVIKLKTGCTPEELSPNNMAEVEYTAVNRTAVIRVLEESCYGDRIIDYDFEKSLTHELLHLKFEAIYNLTELEDRIIHPLIDDMARALVMAKRGKTKRQPYKTNSKDARSNHA
jgi:hypothetical protein